MVTALLTAAGTYTANRFFEGHKRRLDRKTLAASLLAEVETVQMLFLHLGIEEHYRSLGNEMKTKLEEGSTDVFLGIPNDILNFPVTVYEKCADRIGTLGPDAAREVVYFYNFLSGLRVATKIATGDSRIPLARRIDYTELVADMIADERQRLEDVQAKLRRVVGRSGRDVP